MTVGDPAIFISYRRKDAAGGARALYLVLSGWFGADQVFYDHADLLPGEVFPDRLRAAVSGARIVLAVIGPQWLEELNSRAQRPSEVDVVREELRLALSLAGQSQRWVIPVLMECEVMPLIDQLAECLRKDLGGLWNRNARALGGDQRRWGHAVRDLLVHMQGIGALNPIPLAGDDSRLQEAKDQVRKMMASDLLRPLVAAWGNEPLQDLRVAKLDESVAQLGRSISQALPAWRSLRLGATDLTLVKQACRDILAVLYGLAVDCAAARAWVEEPSVDRPVPVDSVGALVFAHAAVHGLKATIPGSQMQKVGFEPVGAVDLGGPDPGGTVRRRTAVQQRLWAETFTDPRMPYPHGERPLGREDQDDLRRRLAARARIERRAFILTEKQESHTSQRSDLDQIASELGMVALPRTGVDRGLLRVDERDFNALTSEVLQLIERIK